MNYHKKLKEFFVNKGLLNKDVAKAINYSEVMVSRYLKSSAPNFEFIKVVTRAYPDIDWNYIFKDDFILLNEDGEVYGDAPEVLLKEIDVRVKKLQKWHNSDTQK